MIPISPSVLTVPVALKNSPFDVLIGDDLLKSAGSMARSLNLPRPCAIITDSIVGPLHAQTVLQSLKDADYDPVIITVPSGEASKCMAVAEECCRQMIRAGLDRKSWVLALGGGVIGDLAGFVASIYFRGIPVIQAPTTIVSFVDSSVGGKTGVNAPEGKNLIGAFHQPVVVLADTRTLTTLPDREFNEGMAEVIKHGAIRDPQMLHDIMAIPLGCRVGLAPLIARNIAIKAAIVSEDEKETLGLRALLNFGHTIGHAIEAEAGYGNMLHGEAISLGLRAALHLSEVHAGLDPTFSNLCLNALKHFHLPLTLSSEFATQNLLSHLAHDKKFEHGSVRFVLLKSPGDAYVSSEITLKHIESAIEFLRQAP